jgi:hypothetical protein
MKYLFHALPQKPTNEIACSTVDNTLSIENKLLTLNVICAKSNDEKNKGERMTPYVSPQIQVCL